MPIERNQACLFVGNVTGKSVVLVHACPYLNSRSQFAFINDDDEYLGSSMFIVCLTRMFVNAWFINANGIPRSAVFIYTALLFGRFVEAKLIGEQLNRLHGLRNNFSAI